MRQKNAPAHLFDQIEHNSLADSAVAQIENLILNGVLREGDMLPGERDLAGQLGISRPKVREALKNLVENKLLRVVANDGIYVDRLGGEIMSPALIALYHRNPVAIRQNLEFRRITEGFASKMAAQRATSNDCERLKEIIEQMEAADQKQDRELASELDLELHSTIVFAAHNYTLTHMMTALYSLHRNGIMYNRIELMNIAAGEDLLFQQHQQIVNAICQGQSAQAEKAAQSHIDFVAELIETVFDRHDRESLSKKRYRKLND